MIEMPPQLWIGGQARPTAYAMARPVNNFDGRLPAGYLKPYGGFWTSTLDTSPDEGWLRWTISEDFRAPGESSVGWALEPWAARVFRVETAEDVELLHDEYGVPDPHVHGFAPASVSRLSERLDWELIREDYDAVHLANPYDFDIRLGSRPTFYGWDCESTLWLRWCFWRARRVDLAPLVAAVTA